MDKFLEDDMILALVMFSYLKNLELRIYGNFLYRSLVNWLQASTFVSMLTFVLAASYYLSLISLGMSGLVLLAKVVSNFGN